MAVTRWRGTARSIQQVNTLTVGGTPVPGQVDEVTINGQTVRYTAGHGDTHDHIAARLQPN